MNSHRSPNDTRATDTRPDTRATDTRPDTRPDTRDNLRASESTVIDSALSAATTNSLPFLLFTCTAVSFLTLRSPGFKKATGPSSRTAIAIMPPFFYWGLTTELEVIRGKREKSWDLHHGKDASTGDASTGDASTGDSRTGDSRTTVANTIAVPVTKDISTLLPPPNAPYIAPVPSHVTPSEYLSEFGTKIQIVSSPTLSPHHNVSNFLSSNPFEVLLGVGIPTALVILKGQSGNKKIKASQMIMHTRVMGQGFAVVLLLSLMGFKAAVDHFGRFVTQEDADGMVGEERRRRGKWVEDMERNARAEMERREGGIKRMKELVKNRKERGGGEKGK
ncbi:hypothetical protein TrRE_jg13635 [Triparma retinervis]|uniref:HIG1 domain-containing protein n=1 Tax=Triparma retinervis TaxID=2557542 RepID=A0A9W6ZE92_9STRA|nr:hypothetical protein TrRE_jg13635 [Triparma retinervis]